MLPGIGGSLFPSRFLADGLPRECRLAPMASPDDIAWRGLKNWWTRVERTCGPATGLRAIFDVGAMPLAAILGFRAREVSFLPGRATACLVTQRGTAVGMIVLPWAARPSRLWRDLSADARALGAEWCLLFAPPFFSIVDARGHGIRRSVDFVLPAALDARSAPVFHALCHASVFDAGRLAGGAIDTPIDRLASMASAFQDAVRRDLQAGVVAALESLSPVIGSPRADRPARFLEALTIVYRVLFLLFAESRDLVPRRSGAYAPAYVVGELCRAAARTPAETAGLWDALGAITRLSRSGCDTPDLIVKPFNGRLFSRAAAPSLERRETTRRETSRSRRHDTALARALAALASRSGPRGREEITYADLGVEQLGAVYERVLDLDPQGKRRKETGTFYTPQPLADFVVRRTLAPLVRGATTDDILALRVVDPAMGSGAFLVSACRYLAHAFEAALVREGRCAETDLDDQARAGIRRLIASRCLTGVDANPVAVQLARLSLWLTSLARDKPLTFLDDRLRVGDSLLGCAPDDLWRRSPSRKGRAPGADSGAPLFDVAGLSLTLGDIARPLRRLREDPDETIDDVRARERLWSEINSARSPLERWRRACDLWCARWFWPGPAPPPSASEAGAAIDAVLAGPRPPGPLPLDAWTSTARDVSHRRQFFHWPIEFADVFYDGTGAPHAQAGFDAVIGNPPWEMLRQDQAAVVSFIRRSGLYPSCDRGHLNLYQPFVDRSLSLARTGGRVGLVLPWGLASDAGASSLRRRLFERGRVDSLVGLDNSAGLFPIHRGLRFMVLVATPNGAPRETSARFGVRTADDIDAMPADAADPAAVGLTRDRLFAIAGPSLRIPDARRPDDLAWLETISSRFPRLGDAGGWNLMFGRELNATDDRPHFGRAGLPIVEGKHITPFRVDVGASTLRIGKAEAWRRLPQLGFTRPRLAYRDVSGVSNRFALIAAIVPAGVVTTHTLFCARGDVPLERQHFLCGLFNSDLVNRIARLLMGGHLTTELVESFPAPPWTGSDAQRRVAALAEQLARGEDADARRELNDLVSGMYNTVP
jgi:hypothetical protein